MSTDSTLMRLEYNKTHNLHMREYGLDKVNVDMFTEYYDPIMDMLNIRRDDIVLDAGAYIGRSARYLFHRDCSMVVSVEAYPNNYQILMQNASDERMLLKLHAAQVHHVVGGAVWQHNIHNSGRVYLNSNSDSRAAMTTYKLNVSKHIAWTNAIPLKGIHNKFNPTVGVFTINGTEMDFLLSIKSLESFGRFREFYIEYNLRTHDHIRKFKEHDRLLRSIGYAHVLEPDHDVLKTKRAEPFLLRVSVIYRRVVDTQLMDASTYRMLNQQQSDLKPDFSTLSDIMEEQRHANDARYMLKESAIN